MGSYSCRHSSDTLFILVWLQAIKDYTESHDFAGPETLLQRLPGLVDALAPMVARLESDGITEAKSIDNLVAFPETPSSVQAGALSSAHATRHHTYAKQTKTTSSRAKKAVGPELLDGL